MRIFGYGLELPGNVEERVLHFSNQFVIPDIMDSSVVDLFAERGKLISKDVSPWQTFSGGGMKFRLQSYDWDGCACVSHMSMCAFFGLMKMETIICTPYSKDLPLFSFDDIWAIGKKTLFLEFYDTLVEPVDLSNLLAVKESYKDLKDKHLNPAWYDSLRLPPCTFKEGCSPRMSTLVTEMTTAYLDLFPTARVVDRDVKATRNVSYVEELIGKGGPAVNTVRKILGKEAGEDLFRRFIFGTAAS